MKLVCNTLLIGALSICAITRGAEAQVNGAGQGTEVFASENAIVDTSIPFAIGAREAQQALRGSYGWPTFQEGLVEGVYFRFDPDGYARFSPNPRLDVDVFEVICKSRTSLCMARKDSLNMFLTDRGQLQLKFESVTPNDTFFIVGGISEIQIPPRILQPLDSQLETLLATGDELIVRRGGEELSRTSLRGFLATVSFLRWVMAGQDYAVLPRDWPVPNAPGQSAGPSTGITTSDWRSPTPQPHVIQAPGIAQSGGSREIEAELRELRRAISALSNPSAEAGQTQDTAATATDQPDQAEMLMAVADKLQAELDRLQMSQATSDASVMPQQEIATFPEDVAPVQMEKPLMSAGQKIEYLMQELGLDMRTAVAVVEMAEQGGTMPRGMAAGMAIPSPEPVNASAPQETLVDQILRELEAEIAAEIPDEAPQELPSAEVEATPKVTVAEYTLLSSYFRSVALPALEAK